MNQSGVIWVKARKIALILSVISGVTALLPGYADAASSGWNKADGNWYYYEDGSMAYGWKQIGGAWYYLNSDGALKTGWLRDNGCWYYLNNSGSMVTGWKLIDGKWHYFNDDGSMSTGWLKNNGFWYYLGYSGSMVTGWKEINGTWYYFNSDGSMKTGWLNDRGTWYYLNDDGSMAHDTIVDGYTISSNGVWIDTEVNGSGIISSNENEKDRNYTFTEGLNKFCADSSSIILSQQDTNINSTYSPVSFYMALSVLSEGADNKTKNDLLKALNVSDADKLREECRELYKKEIFKTNHGICSIADSVWIDDDNDNVEFNEDTLKKIEKDYNAGVFKGDLQSRENAEKISRWLLDNTGGLLGGDPDSFIGKPDEVMDIFNAVYFKDRWESIFDKEDTYEDEFYLNGGKTSKAEYMIQSVDTEINESSNGYKSSSLDFESGHKMMFILPDKGISPYDILSNSSKLNEALSSLSSDKAQVHNVYFKVPKFKFSSNLDLNDCAVKMGLSDIYSDADFTKFSEKGGIRVSNIRQEATVSIDEDGGEAAAYTQISIECTSVYDPDVKTYDMILDRPFIFAITDKDDTPLFIGVINNPGL